MGKITRSLAITSLFPETVASFEALRDTITFLGGRGFGMLEFYTAPGHDAEIAALMDEAGFERILIGVLPLKAAGDSLCATDEAERRRAVTVLRQCLDRAAVLGCRAVMVNSGFTPDDHGQTAAACAAYVRSIGEGFAHIAESGYGMTITLEPGDSCVQSFQLLGPTERVLETTKTIVAQHPRYTLTMDVAHIREEGENVMESLRACLPYCNHIHLCNCLMDDANDAMYGDKHVDFDWPGACYGYEDFERMYGEIKQMYQGRDLIVTLEITYRAADNNAWFEQTARRCSWLFQ